MKYKVGDQVRVRKDLEVDKEYGDNCFVDSMKEYSGKKVTITNICYGNYEIKEDNETFYWTNEMFEGLVTFTKADLRDGDIVTDREGDKSIYCESKLYGQTVELDDLCDDLTDEDGDKEYDIVKVERPVKYETVFEREEEPTKKDKALQKIEELEKQIEELKKEFSS